jgi:CDP-diacylglycerol--serine O-phosphatidyltransferase
MIKLVAPADIITFLNLGFGFLAVLMLFSGTVRLAYSFLFLALLADGLDGVVARRTHKGKMGEYLEAIADMVSLSIAPLVLVYFHYVDGIAESSVLTGLIYVVLLFFLVGSAIRLSSFHILKNTEFFIGLPASVSTIFLLLGVFFSLDFLYMLMVLIMLSVALISPVRFPKPGVVVNSIAVVLIVLFLFFWDFYMNVIPLLLTGALLMYSLIGPWYVWKTRKDLG